MALFGSFGQCLTKNITINLMSFQLAEDENVIVISWTCVLVAARDYRLQFFGRIVSRLYAKISNVSSLNIIG